MSGDWDAVASETERRMDRIEARMDAIDRHFDRLAEQMSSLVSIVISVAERVGATRE